MNNNASKETMFTVQSFNGVVGIIPVSEAYEGIVSDYISGVVVVKAFGLSEAMSQVINPSDDVDSL